MNNIKLFFSISFISALMACGSKSSNYTTDILKVETETVGEETQDLSKSYVGEVEPQSSTAVSFTSMGTVTKVLVEEGQSVSAGQVIAQMDQTQCKNALAAAKAVVAQAEDGYGRMKILHENNSVSDLDWVEVQSKVQQAHSTLDMAQKALDDCTLKAPCSGVIGTKSIQSGQTALPSQPVVNIININSVKVKVSIPEKEIAKITSSTPTHITVDAIGKTLDGGRIEKGVQADAMTHTYDIRINVTNANRELLPGMVANVQIGNVNTEEAEDILTLPVRCIQQSADNKMFVWVEKNGKAHRQDITVGEVYGNRIAVLSGLSKGDKVIVSGYQKVSEGSEVRD